MIGPWSDSAGKHPRACYVICATPRCGSNYLCELLARTDCAGYPKEHFMPGKEGMLAVDGKARRFDEYFRLALSEGVSANGVFGTKIMEPYLNYVDAHLRQAFRLGSMTTPDLLEHCFPNLHYIWISRRDKVRQAVSFYRASQSHVWWVKDPSGWEEETPSFDYTEIAAAHRSLVESDAGWESYFAEIGVSPFRVIYEDLLRQTDAITRKLLQFLGVAVPTPLWKRERSLHKQADALSESWVKQYLDIEARGGEGWSPGLWSRPGFEPYDGRVRDFVSPKRVFTERPVLDE